MESQISNNSDLYIWSYHVQIRNNGNEAIQLINRYWKIIDEMGGTQEVRGAGVIGEQPILAPNSEFKYSSGVNLRYPSGIMSGFYEMKNTEEKIINIKIPAFSLDIPNGKFVVN
jgi:ApaG protein